MPRAEVLRGLGAGLEEKETNRLETLGRVLERRLTQAQSARQLGLSVRQVERLCRKLRIEGPRGEPTLLDWYDANEQRRQQIGAAATRASSRRR